MKIYWDKQMKFWREGRKAAQGNPRAGLRWTKALRRHQGLANGCRYTPNSREARLWWRGFTGKKAPQHHSSLPTHEGIPFL